MIAAIVLLTVSVAIVVCAIALLLDAPALDAGDGFGDRVFDS
jgi:hypothetical protein